MTEPVEGAEGTPTAENAEAGKRGRPRPDEVIQRDEAVLAAVTGSMSRKQIAEITQIKESLVYLSLLRLRNAGKLTHERSGVGHVWAPISVEATPVA